MPLLISTMFAVMVFLIVLGAFLTILSLPLSDVQKFFAEVLLLAGYSYYLHKKYKIEFYYGMLMLKTKEGLGEIDRIAKHAKFWQHFIDTFTVLAYGMLTLLFFKHVKLRDFIQGLLLLFVVSLFILPSIYPIALSVIGLPYDGVTKVKVGGGPDEFVFPLMIAGILLVGLATVVTLGLIYQAVLTLYNIYLNTFGGAAHAIQPGAYLILPGINIPFIEGVIALLLLLFVHELTHAILSRVARVPLNSAGILLFGFIPIGAFVDPSEKILIKKSKAEQVRVIVGGSAANYALSLFSFILLIALLSLPLGAYDSGVYITAAKEGLPVQKGDVILAINGTYLADYDAYLNYKETIQPNSTLVLTTQRGNITVNTDENAYIGLMVQPRIKSSYSWYIFLRNLFALLFTLNFFVGSFNLLPIPLFDGHRLLDLALGEKLKPVLNIITIASSLSFIVALLPWLLK